MPGLVSRFRSSHHCAAHSFANFEIEGHQQLIDLAWLWFRSPHFGLAARVMRTSDRRRFSKLIQKVGTTTGLAPASSPPQCPGSGNETEHQQTTGRSSLSYAALAQANRFRLDQCRRNYTRQWCSRSVYRCFPASECGPWHTTSRLD